MNKDIIDDAMEKAKKALNKEPGDLPSEDASEKIDQKLEK